MEISERNENESYDRMPKKSRVPKSSNLNEQEKNNSMISKPLSVSPDPEPSGLMFEETDVPVSHAGSYVSLVESGNKNLTEASTNSPFLGFSGGTKDATLVKTRPTFRTALAPIENYYETTEAPTSSMCKKLNKESTDSESFRLTFDGSDKTEATSKELASSLDKSRSGYLASSTNNSKDATDVTSFKDNPKEITEYNSEQFSNDDDWATIPDSIKDDLSLSKIADNRNADCGKSNSIVQMRSIDDNRELDDFSGGFSQMVLDNQESSVFEVTYDNYDDKVSLENSRRSSIQPVVLLSRLNLSDERSKRISNVKEMKFQYHSVSMKTNWETSSLNDETNKEEKSASELMEWESSGNEDLQESQDDMESLKAEEVSRNTTEIEESIMEITERDSSKGSFRLSINQVGNTSEKCSLKNEVEDSFSSKKDLNISEVKETSIKMLDKNLIDNRSIIQPIVLLNRLNDPTRITDRRKKYRNWGLSVITENADGKTIEEETKELETIVTNKNETKVEEIERDNIRLSDDRQNKVSQETTISYDASVLSNRSNESMRLDKIVFLKPGKSWSRSLSLFRQVQNHDDIETLAVGKGKKWRQSVQSLLDMQQQGVIQSCVKKNEDDKESQSCYGVRNSAAAWISGCGQPDTSRVLSQTSVGSPGARFIRRVSIRVVPDSKNTEHYEDSPFLEAYGITSCENRKTLGKRSTLIAPRKTLVYNVQCADLSLETIPKSLNSVTSRDVVLTQCGQDSSVPFDEYYPDSYLKHCRKIGEGVFGEVFLYEKDAARTVIKIIPIEGDMKVNGERQKKFDEILSEIVIAKELNNLRYADSCNTSSFVEVKNIRCVYGKYPEMLMDLWQRWDNEKNSENDCPDMFNKNQLYIVLELGHGGQDLEAFVFQNSSEAHALFIQTALALAVAEESLEFEHRDLHWGNILISRTEDTQINYKLRGKDIRVASKGVKVSIIDFTLSRMSYQGCSIFNDLSLDDDLFAAQGEYQFEIYRLMRQKIENNWQTFEPYTNIYWLHYTLDKMITAVRYRRPTSKIHKNGIGRLKELKNEILDYNSAYDFVTNCDNVTRLLASNSSVSKVTSTD